MSRGKASVSAGVRAHYPLVTNIISTIFFGNRSPASLIILHFGSELRVVGKLRVLVNTFWVPRGKASVSAGLELIIHS